MDWNLAAVKLTDAWGINWRMEKRLNNLGIKNLLDLKNYPLANIRAALNLSGYYFFYLYVFYANKGMKKLSTQLERGPY